MSIPRNLTFVNDSGGLALRQQPVIAALRAKTPPIISRSNADLLGNRKGMLTGPAEIHARFQAGQQDAMTDLLYPLSPGTRVEVFSLHNRSVPVDGTIRELTSIWK